MTGNILAYKENQQLFFAPEIVQKVILFTLFYKKTGLRLLKDLFP